MLCFCLAIVYSTSNVSTLSSSKRYTPRNYRWVQSHSCRLHDVPVVIINRQCIELKGFHKSFPRLTTIASKNGYFGHFCTEPDRDLPVFTGTVTLSRSRMDAGVSNLLLQILHGLLSDHKQCIVVNISPSEYQWATGRAPHDLFGQYLVKQMAVTTTRHPKVIAGYRTGAGQSPNDAPICQPGPARMEGEPGQRPCGPLKSTLRFHFTDF